MAAKDDLDTMYRAIKTGEKLYSIAMERFSQAEKLIQEALGNDPD